VRLAICADSFAVSDPDYGPCWADLLAQQYQVINLAQVCATNLLIAQQVEQALSQDPDFVIVCFTSCTRGEKRHCGRIEPFSYHTASATTTPFDQQDLAVLREYFVRFFDLELAIYQNRITIEHTLARLVRSGIPFLFDQGGFEHPQYGDVDRQYFREYNHYRSGINLWDHARTRHYRPFYHIVDPEIHKHVSEYYMGEVSKWVKKEF
jgi:hypothetical protein